MSENNTPNTTKTTNTRTIKLNHPLSQGEQTIDSIDIRMPVAGDLRGVKLADFIMGDVDAYVTVLPRIITNVALHPDSVRDLSFTDLLAIQVQVADFLPQTN